LEIPSNLNISLPTTAKTDLAINKLQQGEQILVKVVEQLPSKTTTILQIGKQLVPVKTDITLSPGQTLKVIVEKAQGELTLKLPPKLQLSSILDTSLRQLLPKQMPVAEFQQPLAKTLSSLQQLTSQTPNQETQQHENRQGRPKSLLNNQLIQLKRISNNIIQSLPTHQQISTAKGLKAAINNSGNLLEATLLQTLVEKKLSTPQITNLSRLQLTQTSEQQAPIQVDLKANLSKLIKLLKAWPKLGPSIAQHDSMVNTSKQQGMVKPQINQHTPPQQSPTVLPQVLENQVKDLLNKTEGALAKITLNQLASTNTESSASRQTWQIEIPLFNNQQADSIFLKIERELSHSKTAHQGEQAWTISIEMTPPKLGLIRSKLSLLDDQVSSNFWAENEGTRTLIQQHVDLLRKQFQRVNLHANHIQVQQGSGASFQEIKPRNNLLSEKA